MDATTRRRYLQWIGGTALAGFAGCTGDGGDGDGGETLSGSDYPAIDEWLSETEIGDSDDTYDGTLVDRRNQDTLTIRVGATGNGGNFAYSPSAVVVSTGTNIEWSWSGQGNPHNVEALPEEQLGKSDYEFSSGEPEGGSGVKYSRSLDPAGTVLYHCEPHLPLGMKGGIAVE